MIHVYGYGIVTMKCNSQINYMEIINTYHLLKCTQCKLIAPYAPISCHNTYDKISTTFICDICQPKYTRTVICSLCGAPTLKILDNSCNHVLNYCGHHVCCFKNCGLAFITSNECYTHLCYYNNAHLSDTDIIYTEDEDMTLCENYTNTL